MKRAMPMSGPLARAVDAEVAQPNGGEAVRRDVGARERLGHHLGRPVRARSGERRRLGHRQLGRVAVHARRRRVDELHVAAGARVEQLPSCRSRSRARSRRTPSSCRARPAAPRGGRPRRSRRPGGSSAVAWPRSASCSVKAGPAAQRRDVALLALARVVGREVVDAAHRGAGVEQRLAQVRTDEPCGAGDQVLHDGRPG